MPDSSSSSSRLPKAVSQRLSRPPLLQGLESGHKETVSSSQLARSLGLTAAQVRRDLAYFGQFGFPAWATRSRTSSRRSAGSSDGDRTWQVALVGAGNLGTALIRYRGFRKQGFEIAAVFDADPKLEGKAIAGLAIKNVRHLSRVVRESGIRIAILAVPAEAGTTRRAAASRRACAGS